MKRIDSRTNSRIKLARSLRTRKSRDKEGLFVVEGLFHIGEALASGAEIDFVLTAPNLLSGQFGRELLDGLSDSKVDLYEVDGQLLNDLSNREQSRGLMAICRTNYSTLEQLDSADVGRLIAMVAPQDPGNVGAVLRSIDAFGMDGLLLLDGGVDAFHPSAVRAGMGTHFRKPLIRASFQEGVDWANRNEYALIGSSAKEGLPLQQAQIEKPFILLLGSEREGLSKTQRVACDQLLKIEMQGEATSLNLAVAAGILMWGLAGMNK
jgi:TrmH family RNA methyltransferase